MSIEFIRDEFLEGKKEELDNINEVISTKPKKIDRNVLFLKRFTLALMGQYKIHKKEIESTNRQIVEQLYQNRQRIMPMPPSPRMQIPRPQMTPKPQPRIPAPLKEEIKIPEPIEIENPKEAFEVKLNPTIYIGTKNMNNNQKKPQEKKEIPAPI